MEQPAVKTYKKNLVFDYPATSKIRIKISNCFECVEYPLIYRIVTDKLDFLIPKEHTIVSTKYVYVPLFEYHNARRKYYFSVQN